MSGSHWSGPLYSGDLQAGQTNGPNIGSPLLVQTMAITQNSTNAVSATVYVPAGARIVDFYVDIMTPFDSVTSAVLSVGTSAGATTYLASIDVKGQSGRVYPAMTAAQVAAAAGYTTTGGSSPTVAPVTATVTPTGATTAGYIQVVVLYVQQ